jgi:Mannosyl-glycoprotein endo-beta-N-acetylglucosaminidase
MARSPLFDNVDPGLVAAFEANQGVGPYSVRATSGYRPGDPRYHGKGAAMDIELYDPKTGTALDNYQNAQTAQAYQQYANKLYQWAQQNNPQLAEQLRWGGYFSGGPGKYGALDLMHFDVGGGAGGTPMAGGSWGTGFTPEQMAIWGIKDAGGQGQGPSGGAPADPQQAYMQQMWAYAQAQGARTGVDPRIILAQSAIETGYGKHVPNNNYFGIKGEGGAPQQTLEFINGKMTPTQANFRGYENPEASFTGYGDFLLANPRYGDLRAAKGLEAQAAALQASGYATDPEYGKKVLAIAQGIPETGFGAATPNTPLDSTTPKTTGIPVPAKPEDKQSPFAKAMEGLGGGLGDMGMGGAAAPLQTNQAAAAPSIQMPSQSIINPDAANAQRQQLAEVMARLNSGRLFG